MSTADAADTRTQYERMLAGDLYIADDPDIAREQLRAMSLMEAYNASPAAEPDERGRILRRLLGAVGEGTEIRPPLTSTMARTSGLGRGRSRTSGSWRWTSPRSRSATTYRSGPTCNC